MAEVKCSECKGKGHVTKLIASDVHIAECQECLGWGTVTEIKPRVTMSKFGKLKHPHSVNLDELLKG